MNAPATILAALDFAPDYRCECLGHNTPADWFIWLEPNRGQYVKPACDWHKVALEEHFMERGVPGFVFCAERVR
jgi:hypothetical protein